jgi:hypothetical protein
LAWPPAGPQAGWLRWWFKAPVLLYRLRLGVLFGHRILVVVHHGRCSGVRRWTALEIASTTRRPTR